MKTYITVLALLLFTSNIVIGQESINNYKYVVIPAQFEFQSGEDQYQLNALAKFLFNKHGFRAFLANEQLPPDLVKDQCKALTAQVVEVKGGLFKTKLQIDLIDCMGNVIETSQVGETREKVYKTAYQLALRDAFKSFMMLDYKYVPQSDGSFTDRTENAKVVVEEPEQNNLDGEVKPADDAESEKPSIKEEDLKDEIPAVVVTGIPEIDEVEKREPKPKADNENRLLYAQPISNGFQIVDTEPKKVMVLLNTDIDNVFMVKGKDAIVYKKNGQWMYAEMKDTLSTKELNIKF